MAATIYELPTAIVPIYVTPNANEPITLYQGPLTYRQRVDQQDWSESGEGRIVLNWLPRPNITCYVEIATAPPAHAGGAFSCGVRIGGMDQKRRPRFSCAPLIIAAAIVLLLVLYVLSYGPCAWLLAHGRLPESLESIASWIYAPLGVLSRTLPPFRSFMEWYLAFFVKLKR